MHSTADIRSIKKTRIFSKEKEKYQLILVYKSVSRNRSFDEQKKTVNEKTKTVTNYGNIASNRVGRDVTHRKKHGTDIII